jgi:hypothetical protein
LIGVAELLVIVLFVFGPLLALLLWFWVVFANRAKRFGYPSRRAYLLAAPRSDEERKDAADLALKGLVFCLLGLLLAPLVLVGLVPSSMAAGSWSMRRWGLASWTTGMSGARDRVRPRRRPQRAARRS